MIEIEKKVRLEERHIQMIEKNAAFLKVDRFTDVYYDTDDYCLTKANVWLRQRESRFELKVGVRRENGSIDRFEEIVDEREILDRLGLAGKLPHALESAEIFPFCTFATERKKYVWGEIAIDLDMSDFGDFIYQVAEFEIQVPSEKEIPLAEEKIKGMLDLLKLKEAIVPGKLIYYISKKRPAHYQALIQIKVVNL